MQIADEAALLGTRLHWCEHGWISVDESLTKISRQLDLLATSFFTHIPGRSRTPARRCLAGSPTIAANQMSLCRARSSALFALILSL